MLSIEAIKHIKQISLNLSAKFKLNYAHGINIQNIIEKYYNDKIILCSLAINSDFDAAINYHKDEQMYVLVINENRITPSLIKRLNFSLAHELGHYELNHAQIFMENPELKGEKYFEEMADEFAGQLLVPKSELQKCWQMSLSKLSDKFKVSEEVIKIRLKKTGVMKEHFSKIKTPKTKDDLIKEIFNITQKSKGL